MLITYLHELRLEYGSYYCICGISVNSLLVERYWVLIDDYQSAFLTDLGGVRGNTSMIDKTATLRFRKIGKKSNTACWSKKFESWRFSILYHGNFKKYWVYERSLLSGKRCPHFASNCNQNQYQAIYMWKPVAHNQDCTKNLTGICKFTFGCRTVDSLTGKVKSRWNPSDLGKESA